IQKPGVQLAYEGADDNRLLAVLPEEKPRHAAGCIAASLRGTAVRIVKAHPDIGPRRGGQQQDNLVAADAEVAIRDPCKLLLVQFEWRLAGVEDDEVIAQPMHFAKRNLLRHDGQPPWAQVQ